MYRIKMLSGCPDTDTENQADYNSSPCSSCRQAKNKSLNMTVSTEQLNLYQLSIKVVVICLQAIQLLGLHSQYVL